MTVVFTWINNTYGFRNASRLSFFVGSLQLADVQCPVATFVHVVTNLTRCREL